MAPRGMNPTGFDVKKFVASTGMGTNDPWARRYDLSLIVYNINAKSIATEKLGDIRVLSVREIGSKDYSQVSESLQSLSPHIAGSNTSC